jgi:transcription initiation factor TFIIF subunit alpha
LYCGVVLDIQFYVSRNTKKKYQVMRFTSSVNVDFKKWMQVKMERENNMKEFRGTEEEIPKSVLAALLYILALDC